MLTTLLGDIEIYVDDNKVEYMEKYLSKKLNIIQNSTPMRRETSKGVEILESSKARKRKQVKIPPL